MSDIFPPVKQRPALLELAEALDSRLGALRRDECGDWAIFGKRGHIYAVPLIGPVARGVPVTVGFQLVIGTAIEHESRNSARQWTADKKRLAFCQVTQDGDEEGCLILGRLPTKAEGAIIRDVLRIPKAKHLSEEQREACIRRGTINLQRFRDQGTEPLLADFKAQNAVSGTSRARGAPNGRPWR
jgi:hypothetical protein